MWGYPYGTSALATLFGIDSPQQWLYRNSPWGKTASCSSLLTPGDPFDINGPKGSVMLEEGCSGAQNLLDVRGGSSEDFSVLWVTLIT